MEQNKDKKLYLLMGILIILILIVLRSLITSQNGAIIDYDEITSGIQIASKGTVTKDREIYFIVEDILINMSNSYSNNDENEMQIEDYYEVLNKSYKNKISKSKYSELVENFLSNMKDVIIDTDGRLEVVETKNIIREIYKLENDSYICIVGAENATTFGYIGITLNTEKNTFEIFYLE